MPRVKMVTVVLCCLVISTQSLAATLGSPKIKDPRITLLNNATKTQLDKKVLLDARSLVQCQTSSVSGAICLPSGTFHSAKGDLASFYDIAWIFGTADLKETDDVLVFSDEPHNRLVLAGLLFLAGQHKVSLWSGNVSALEKLLGKSVGRSRGILRSRVYQGIMRDHYIVLPLEINTFLQKGWEITSDSALYTGSKFSAIKLLITGQSPVENIATFARLLTEGRHQLLLNIINKS